MPPLKYDWVYRLKALRPHLTIVLNGGVTSLEQTKQHYQYVDGVMIGREAWHNTFFLADVDAVLFNDDHVKADRISVTRGFPSVVVGPFDKIRTGFLHRWVDSDQGTAIMIEAGARRPR